MWLMIDRAAGWASGLAFYVAVVLLVVLMAVGTLDVVMVQGFRHAIPGAVELSEAALAVLTFLGLPQVQRVRGHITIDLFTERLSSASARRFLVFSSLVEIAFFAAMGAAAWALTLRSIKLNEQAIGYLSFPLYPGKLLVVVGVLLATVELIRQTIALIIGREMVTRKEEAI
ncbi:TRAP transporter small permease [Rhizobiaceae sp. 2RAB30]